MNNLTKSEIRYILYRKRNSILDNQVIFDESDVNAQVVSYFENQKDFKKYGGWVNFAMKWDVDFLDGQWCLVYRKTSETKEWDAVLQYRVEIFPTLSDSIYKKIIN